jgi:signal transduction histidine kinase
MPPDPPFASETRSGTRPVLDEYRELQETNDRLVEAAVQAAAHARDQREANERLVLAVLRAHEHAADQCEANERLAVAATRAHEEADVALGAQRCAEDDATVNRDTATELRALAEDRERIIGIVGHDLRTPLTTVVLAAGRLARSARLSAEDAEMARRIIASGTRMADMVSDLLEFTRTRLGGGFHLTLRPCDLGQLCRGIVDELRLASSVTIECTSVGDLNGSLDGGRVSEALSNLTGNAVDHATPGTTVRVAASGDGDAVLAEVTNRGDTISADAIPEIFKAFHRGESAAYRGGGHLGLGLYIASEIARAHGGTLTVRSADGTTTFALRLPRAAPDGRPVSTPV